LADVDVAIGCGCTFISEVRLRSSHLACEVDDEREPSDSCSASRRRHSGPDVRLRGRRGSGGAVCVV
jgi:hypothetical protein